MSDSNLSTMDVEEDLGQMEAEDSHLPEKGQSNKTTGSDSRVSSRDRTSRNASSGSNGRLPETSRDSQPSARHPTSKIPVSSASTPARSGGSKSTATTTVPSSRGQTHHAPSGSRFTPNPKATPASASTFHPSKYTPSSHQATSVASKAPLRPTPPPTGGHTAPQRPTPSPTNAAPSFGSNGTKNQPPHSARAASPPQPQQTTAAARQLSQDPSFGSDDGQSESDQEWDPSREEAVSEKKGSKKAHEYTTSSEEESGSGSSTSDGGKVTPTKGTDGARVTKGSSGKKKKRKPDWKVLEQAEKRQRVDQSVPALSKDQEAFLERECRRILESGSPSNIAQLFEQAQGWQNVGITEEQMGSSDIRSKMTRRLKTNLVNTGEYERGHDKRYVTFMKKKTESASSPAPLVPPPPPRQSDDGVGRQMQEVSVVDSDEDEDLQEALLRSLIEYCPRPPLSGKSSSAQDSLLDQDSPQADSPAQAPSSAALPPINIDASDCPVTPDATSVEKEESEPASHPQQAENDLVGTTESEQPELHLDEDPRVDESVLTTQDHDIEVGQGGPSSGLSPPDPVPQIPPPPQAPAVIVKEEPLGVDGAVIPDLMMGDQESEGDESEVQEIPDPCIPNVASPAGHGQPKDSNFVAQNTPSTGESSEAPSCEAAPLLQTEQPISVLIEKIKSCAPNIAILPFERQQQLWRQLRVLFESN